jgi:3-deoxy-manno-octulosonate cytidylyltransferase (CMP-KDO synthetase)
MALSDVVCPHGRCTLSTPSAIAIIPARFASVRLPGKPILRDPAGKTIIEYVCAAASAAARISRVIVATDDDRIAAVVREAGYEARMTSPNHPSGSDRIAEVVASLQSDIVVNVQGDEPMIRPEMIDQVISLLQDDAECQVSTLVTPINSSAELADPNVVKVVVDNQWRALYFSRSPIPYVRGAKDQLAESPLPHLHHIGMYGYRRPFLLQYVKLPRPAVEDAEKLEQLRVLAAGHRIKVGVTPHAPIGIDTPEDFEAFCRRAQSGKL